jgi:hypothetical protein
MPNYAITWNRIDGIDAYDVYTSTQPGATYTLLSTVQQEIDTAQPTYMHPVYQCSVDMAPVAPIATQDNRHICVSWTEAQSGLPSTFKVAPAGSTAPPADTVMIHGSMPAEATWILGREAAFDQSIRFNDEAALLVSGSSLWPRMTISATPMHTMIVWALIDPSDIPQSVWVECLVDGSWEHRVYFGADIAPDGLSGTPSLTYGGPLPSAGCWTPLIVRGADIGAKVINGIGIGIPEGHKIHIGAICFSDGDVLAAQQPHTRVETYNIYRDGAHIATTKSTAYDDLTAIDIDTSPAYDFDVRFEQLDTAELGTTLLIAWRSAGAGGTYYEYAITSIATTLEESSPAVCAGIVDDSYGYVNIYYSTSTISPDNPGTLLSQESGHTYTHEGLMPGTTYWYRFDVHDSGHTLLQSHFAAYTVQADSALDTFILDHSALA